MGFFKRKLRGLPRLLAEVGQRFLNYPCKRIIKYNVDFENLSLIPSGNQLLITFGSHLTSSGIILVMIQHIIRIFSTIKKGFSPILFKPK